MSKITLFELAAVLKECGDQDATVITEIEESTADITFDELGYDSLARFNTIEELIRRYGIEINYDESAAAKTPREFLSIVNSHTN